MILVAVIKIFEIRSKITIQRLEYCVIFVVIIKIFEIRSKITI